MGRKPMADRARTIDKHVRLNPDENQLVEQAVAADRADNVGAWMRDKVLAAAKRAIR